ncbi:hypothetical protein D3C74_459480 [compost metagenome]
MVLFGGSATPKPEFPATSVAARLEDQPFSFIHGMVTEPTVAVLPAVDPATSPIAAEPRVET